MLKKNAHHVIRVGFTNRKAECERMNIGLEREREKMLRCTYHTVNNVYLQILRYNKTRREDKMGEHHFPYILHVV